MASLILGEDGSNGATSAAAALPRPKLTRQLTGTSDDADEVMGGMNSQVETDESSSTNDLKTSNQNQNDGGVGGGYQSTSSSNIKLTFNMGGVKDEGVKGKENQDDYFIWSKGDGKTYVIAILDGHGRELGNIYYIYIFFFYFFYFLVQYLVGS